MQQQEVLVVDDDRSVLETIKGDLRRERFAVRTAASVPEAIERLSHPLPDAMVLDISLGREPSSSGLPDDGLELLRWLRRRADLPVIMLSGTDAESVKVLALNLGADDYVTKPFGGHELAARLRAVLRRAAPAGAGADPGVLRFGSLEIDPSRHTVLLGGEPVRLTYMELEILKALALARGRVLTRGQLLDAVFGAERWIQERTIDVHVRRLREKLETDPSSPEIILTVRGMGYCFGLS